MTRLADAGITNMQWVEDEEGVITGDGLQYYEIDLNNELAIFQGDKCVKVVECEDVCHAYAIAIASEGVCRWNIKQGQDGNGWKVNENGWRIKERA